MKKTLKYYLVIVFILSLVIFTACGILTTQEKGAFTVFGKETETIQLSTEEIGAELRKLF